MIMNSIFFLALLAIACAQHVLSNENASMILNYQGGTAESPRRLQVLYTTNRHFRIILADSLVSGIHIGLTHRDTVIIIDRKDTINSKVFLPGTQEYAYAVEFNLLTRRVRPLNVITNTFCSNGQFLPDGTLVSIGGDVNRDDGGFSIRYFKPCTNNLCDFTLAGRMFSNRWYPSTQILPDGRIFILGGSYYGIQINNDNANNPTYEFWPRRDGDQGTIRLELLVATMPFNLYPILHLLPSGNLFIFSDRSSIIFNYSTNQVVKTLPDMGPREVTRQFPLEGTSFMLPLTSRNNYRAEIVICGGCDRAAFTDRSVRSTNHCGRIAPEAANARWEDDYMPMPRVLPNSVILADGKVLIINGVEYGFGSLNQNDYKNPVLQPAIYDPNQRLGKRWALVPDNTTIPRVYHSSTLLLPDSTVMLAGSNPNLILTTDGPLPTEFRVEAFTPDYLLTGRRRPRIQRVSAVRYGQQFTAVVASRSKVRSHFRACLINTGFSTHGFNFGQRHIFVDIISITFFAKTFRAVIATPPKVIAPPGYYQFNILERGVPSERSKFVQIS